MKLNSSSLQKGLQNVFKSGLVVLTLGVLAGPALSQAAPATQTTPAAPAKQAKGGQRRAAGAAIATLPLEVIDLIASLKPEQKTKVQTILDKAKTDAAAAPDRAGKAEVNTKATDEIKTVLTPEQVTAVQKGAPTFVMLNASKTIPFGAVADVKLTTEQITKLDTIVATEQAKLKGLKNPELKEKRTEAYADLKTQVEALLTADQKTALAKYEAAHPAGKKKAA